MGEAGAWVCRSVSRDGSRPGARPGSGWFGIGSRLIEMCIGVFEIEG